MLHDKCGDPLACADLVFIDVVLVVGVIAVRDGAIEGAEIEPARAISRQVGMGKRNTYLLQNIKAS